MHCEFWLGDYSHDVFHVEGFPLQRPDCRVEELYIVVVLFCVFLTHAFLTLTILISNQCFNCNTVFKGTVEPRCAESAIKFKSISQLFFQAYSVLLRIAMLIELCLWRYINWNLLLLL